MNWIRYSTSNKKPKEYKTYLFMLYDGSVITGMIKSSWNYSYLLKGSNISDNTIQYNLNCIYAWCEFKIEGEEDETV